MLSLSRRRMLQLSTGAVATLAAPHAFAHSRVEEDWSSDIAILQQAWVSMHPGLLRYSTIDDIQMRCDQLARSWAEPSSFRNRLLTLSQVTAAVKCGHTFPSPFNSSDAIVGQMYEGRRLVPFRFRWIGGAMVVTHDAGDGQFRQGDVVTAIDDVATSDLLDELITMARADGSNDAKRVSLMEVRGTERYETFDIHLPLVHPLSETATFSLADGRSIEAGLLTLAERQEQSSTASQQPSDWNPWSLSMSHAGVAHLTMPTWALYNSDFDWEAWLSERMDELASDPYLRGLIVDLRGNEGGQDCGDLIARHLIDRDLVLPQNQRWVRYQSAPDFLRPYLDTWDRSFLDWGERASPSSERPGFFELRREGGESGYILQPAGRRFTKEVVVLCDATNSSATFNFAQLVQDQGLATLLGEPTGGNRRGMNGGAYIFLQLPASGMEVDLPLIASFPSTPQPDAPVLPDVFVTTTIDHVRRGEDPQIAAASDRLISGFA